VSNATSLSAAGAGALPGRDVRSRAHALRFVIEQARRNSIAVLIVVASFAPIVGPIVGWWRFGLWAVLLVAVYAVRVVILAPAMRMEVLAADIGRWTRILFGSTMLAGIVGASASLLFFPLLPPLEQVLVTMILCCWVTGAMSSVGAYPLLYSCYVSVFIGQLIAAWLLTNTPHMASITIPLFGYGLITAAFGRTFARQIAVGLRIRFENEELIQELDAARRAADAANLAKSRFLAVASHDLRQPLHALTILSGLLCRPASAERTGEVAQQIVRSVGSLEKLFSSLLDLSRLDVGAVRPELRTVSLRPILEQLGTEYGPRARVKGLNFEVGHCEAALVTDPVLLERILRNLIDNAIKYTERGRVELGCERLPDALVISVTDTGPGIRPEDRDAVFEEFYQASGERQYREQGLGLGLAIVKRLTGLLGYRIEIVPAPAGGSMLSLVIPADLLRAIPEESGAVLQDSPNVSLERFAIVYLDDDVQVHAAMRLLLQEWGCDAVIAATLDEARTQLRERALRPEAVLTDYSLSAGVTGFDVIDALRAQYGALPAAIITGETDPISREQLRNSEYPVLLKPVQADELRKLLELFRTIG